MSDKHERELGAIDSRLGSIEKTLERMESRQEKGMQTHGDRISSLEKAVDIIKAKSAMIASFFALIVSGVIAAIRNFK